MLILSARTDSKNFTDTSLKILFRVFIAVVVRKHTDTALKILLQV